MLLDRPFTGNATEEFFVRKRPLYEVKLSVACAVQSSSTIHRSSGRWECGEH